VREVKNRGKGKDSGQNKSNILTGGIGILGLVLLTGVAFWGPKLVFAVQDDIRCGVLVSMSPEEMDIASVNTRYETDLYSRLSAFSRGLAEGKRYYVATQEREVTPELTEWLGLDSEMGFEQNKGFQMLTSMMLLPDEIVDYNIMSWKQCVVYGEDFREGVNFILWYIELGNYGEPVVRLLMDGETGELYGVRTDFSSYFSEYYVTPYPYYGIKKGSKYSYAATFADRAYSLGEFFFDFPEEEQWQFCSLFGEVFGGLQTLYEELFAEMSRMSQMAPMSQVGDREYSYETVTEYEQNESGETVEIHRMIMYDLTNTDDTKTNSIFDEFLKGFYWQTSNNKNCMDFHFPYGGNGLTLRVKLDGEIRISYRLNSSLTDMTFGFPEIYELVPDFTAD